MDADQLNELGRFYDQERQGVWRISQYLFVFGWTAVVLLVATIGANPGHDGSPAEPFVAGMWTVVGLLLVGYAHTRRQQSRKDWAETRLSEIHANLKKGK